MNLKFVSGSLVVGLLGFASFLAPGLSAAEQREASFRGQIERSIGYDYLLSLPKNYGETDKPWPLLLFLHGAGERGDDLTRIKRHGPPKLIEQGKELPFIVVSPQCPRNQIWDSAVLLKLLDHIESDYRVDASRIYVTGLSMGGFGTWGLIGAAPQRFAAAAPICGGGNFIEFVLGGQAHRQALSELPLWVFHGAKDQVVGLNESERLVEMFRRTNKLVKFTVYPEANHDSWTETYDNPALYDWFLAQSRK